MHQTPVHTNGRHTGSITPFLNSNICISTDRSMLPSRNKPIQFIPDIWYENILIQSAVWRVHTKDYSKKDFKKFVELFNSEKTLLGFTRYIYISDYDRKILIDTQNSGYMQLLY